MGRHHHLPPGPDVVARDPPVGGQGVCHDRPMAVRAAPAVPERQARRVGRARRTTLFRRLFLTYAAVVGLAVAGLVLAPITVSVPTALAELAVILGGFAVTLVLFHAFLRRALAPLETLTEVMHQIDPLAPGQRIDTTTGDEEVVALAEAFNAMLDRLESERRDSGRRALAAQEAERRRIARELHDEIGQLLTGLILRGETLARRAPEEVREDVVALREGAREAAEEVRLIARRLRPEALDELGLQSALLALCTTVAERAGLEVERRFARDLPLTAEEELVIYRVAQESLTNVVRHAQARQVMVTLEPDDDGGVVLTVRDDGIGLPPEVADDSSGIRGMRERALLVGAQLTVSAVDPHGTEVALRLPDKDVR